MIRYTRLVLCMAILSYTLSTLKCNTTNEQDRKKKKNHARHEMRSNWEKRYFAWYQCSREHLRRLVAESMLPNNS